MNEVELFSTDWHLRLTFRLFEVEIFIESAIIFDGVAQTFLNEVFFQEISAENVDINNNMTRYYRCIALNFDAYNIHGLSISRNSILSIDYGYFILSMHKNRLKHSEQPIVKLNENSKLFSQQRYI